MLGKESGTGKPGQAAGRRAIAKAAGSRQAGFGLQGQEARSRKYRAERVKELFGRGEEFQGEDYRKYRMKGADITICAGKAAVFSLAVSWLFYRSWIGMFLFLAVCPLLIHQERQEKTRVRQETLRNQFKECIRVVTASMYAGYAAENAFREAEKELVQLLGERADMCRELRLMNQQMKLNIPIERLLENLANRSGVEEIFSFGQVFGYAKRSGGDFVRILRDTAERISEKAKLEQEIQTLIAARRLEQKIMNLVPLGILFFISWTSPEFLEMMYAGAFGRICMTGCLSAYIGAYLLSRKLVDIRV